MSGRMRGPIRIVLATIGAMVGLLGLSNSLAEANVPEGTETTELVVQNAGSSPATYYLHHGTMNGSPTATLTDVVPGGSRIIPVESGPLQISSDQPVSSIVSREITSAAAFANHSFAISNTAVQGAPAVAIPILLNDFSGERWNSRYSVTNFGSTVACVRATYHIAASLGSDPVGQAVIDNPAGEPGCSSGYPIEPGATVSIGNSLSADRPFPAQTANTQMAAIVEVTNHSLTNSVAVIVDLYRSDGARLLASYNGFAFNKAQPLTDDVGTEVVVPLAIKHSSGYYSVVGVQNLGPAATDVHIRYLGQTESGIPVDQTVTLPSVARVGFHSTFSTSTPLPVDFVGYAVVTSSEPVAAVLVRAKQTSYLSGVNEPVYTAVNGVPRDRAATNWNAPLVYRRLHEFPTDVLGLNSWLQVQVADGSSATVTVRMTGTPGKDCPTGPFETAYQVEGSIVIYQNADTLNGFPAGQSPSCFIGAAQVTGTKPLIVIANVSSDSYPGGDNEALYNAVPVPRNCAPEAYQVALFVDANFGAYCTVIGLGEYQSMDSVGFPNEALSSVKVGGNVQLTIYDQRNFLGSSVTFYGDYSQVMEPSVGDNDARSFKVQARSFSATGCQPEKDEVALFVEEDYQGYCIVKGLGEYSDISAEGFPNDALSSAKIGRDVRLLAFANPGFEGDGSILESDKGTLIGDPLGPARASSFKVQPRRSRVDCVVGPNQVALFVDANYGGFCVTAEVGEYPTMGFAGFLDESLTSVKVGSEVELVLYEGTGLAGASTTFYDNALSVAGSPVGDNRAKSFKVRLRPDNVGCRPGSNEAALFVEVDFGGYCVVKGIGQYASMSDAGFPTDALSSVRVGANVRLTAFAEPNFQGASSTFEGDSETLVGLALGLDRAKSFKIEPRGLAATDCKPAPVQVALFIAAAYQGGCTSIGIGDYSDITDIGFPNDALSSVLFAPRTPGATGGAVEIVVYQYRNFQGASTVIRNSSAALTAYSIGNNRASSFKVRAATCTPGQQEVSLFVDSNGGADCIVLGLGDYPNVTAMGFPNDALSSVVVGCGVELVLYDLLAFSGTTWVYRWSNGIADSLPAIQDDRTSSLKIRPGGAAC